MVQINSLSCLHMSISSPTINRYISSIAEILNNGGIVGLPTDTVYVLVAACKFPAAVEVS